MNHDERYKLAIKLLKEGKTDNEVVDVFRNEEDFNEKVTRYQIAFLRQRAEYFRKQETCKHENVRLIETCVDCDKVLIQTPTEKELEKK